MSRSVLWLRRDLRLDDHPALLAATRAAEEVVALFVLDDALLRPAGAARRAFLFDCLRDWDAASGGRLVLRHGDPATVVPELAAQVGAGEVHVSADTGPYGSGRDRRVAAALAERGARLVATGCPYAVAPGRLRSSAGGAYRVYGAYYRAWRAHGWAEPAPAPTDAAWAEAPRVGTSRAGARAAAALPLPDRPDGLDGVTLPPAGEAAARAALDHFLATVLDDYADTRDRPDRPGTSRLSVYLKYGCLHPRTVLAALDRAGDPDAPGSEAFRRELAWREFYADVVHDRPDSARTSLREPAERPRVDTGAPAQERFTAWTEGRTGYPLVDAGMRQLRGEAWMHNRVRMVTASFLVKDLHLDWTWGARWFLRHLVDGDLASNNQGWQWVAGTGTDAAPYHRIFNPVTQGRRFDPDGDYVRRWVPELRAVAGAAVHEPWRLPAGLPAGYPARIVDHGTERVEALARWQPTRGRTGPGG